MYIEKIRKMSKCKGKEASRKIDVKLLVKNSVVIKLNATKPTLAAKLNWLLLSYRFVYKGCF